MTKKISLILNFFFLSAYLMLGIPLALGQNTKPISPDELLHGFEYVDESHKDQPSKIDYVRNLPQGSWQQILAEVIKFILGITGTLALISFTVSGIMMVTARGEEEQITKAKMMVLWSVLALLIIAVSYAIVLGVSQLKFF
jgi:hypothetical protein